MSELFESVKAALAERRVSLDCASCGQREDWGIGYGEMGNLHVLLPLGTPHGQLVETPTSRGGLPVVPMICGNCGYTRFYALAVLLGEDWAKRDE